MCQLVQLVEPLVPILAEMMRNQPHADVIAEEDRIPVKCVSLLFDCIIKSPEWAVKMGEEAPTGASPELTALIDECAAPSADLRGVELAEWMFNAIMSGLTIRERFKVNVFAVAAILNGLIKEAQRSGNIAAGLQRARQFYNRIGEFRDEVTHTIILTAYRRAGMHAEADALTAEISRDPIAGARPGISNMKLAKIHHVLNTRQRQPNLAAHRVTPLTAEKRVLMDQAEQLWSAGKEKPLDRLSEVFTGWMIKLYALMGDVPRQLAIIREALEAEKATAHALVLVNPACYGQLFDTMSASAKPHQWMDQAKAAYVQMQQRHEAAAKGKDHKRYDSLRVHESHWSAFIRYLQRTDQFDELDRVWLSAPRYLKQANPQA